jgi:hypothetical protein
MSKSEKITRVVFDAHLVQSKQPHRKQLVDYIRKQHSQTVSDKMHALSDTCRDLCATLESCLYTGQTDLAREIAQACGDGNLVSHVDAFICRDFIARSTTCVQPVLPTERNLYDAIIRRNDTLAVLLLSQGAPLSRAALLELIEAHKMARTVTYLLQNGRVDFSAISFSSWLGCVNSPNVPLSHAIFENSKAVQAEFAAQTDTKRQQIGHIFFYWAVRYLAQLALDGQSVCQFKQIFATDLLTPDEIFTMIRRCGDVWKELPDANILPSWNNPEFASCFLPLVELVSEYNDPKPDFTAFFLEASQKLARYVLTTADSVEIYAILFLPTVHVPFGLPQTVPSLSIAA